MLKDYLDRDIYNLITKTFSFSDITEIRMRANENLIIIVKNKKYYLKDDNGEFVKVNRNVIENGDKHSPKGYWLENNSSLYYNLYSMNPKTIHLSL